MPKVFKVRCKLPLWRAEIYKSAHTYALLEQDKI